MGGDAGRPRLRRDHHRRERALGKRHGVSVAAGHDAGADVVKARLRDASTSACAS